MLAALRQLWRHLNLHRSSPVWWGLSIKGTEATIEKTGFTDAQLGAVLDALGRHRNRVWSADCLWHLVHVLMYSGMRVSEALNASYDTEAKVIHITGAKTASGNRSIPMHTKLADGVHITAIETHKASQRATAGTLATAFWRLVKSDKDLEQYDLSSKELSLHSIRHTVTTKLVEAETPYHLLQRIMGHKSADVAMRVYAKTIKADIMREWVEKLAYDI